MRLTLGRVGAGALALALSVSARAGTCLGDLDGSGAIGGADLAQLLGQWGDPGLGPADLNQDGTVDGADLAIVLAGWGECGAAAPMARELAAVPLAGHPFGNFVASFNAGSTVHVGVDPIAVPSIANQTVDVYVVSDRTSAEWESDQTLVDQRGAPESVTFGATLDTCVRPLATGALPATSDLSIAVGYDLVLDMNGNGSLDGGDLIDGMGDEAGFWMVTNLTAQGPLAVSTVSSFDTNDSEIPTSFQLERIYYPSDVQSMPGALPLVVISHGNGHQYTWYDYLGNHLASWGFIVMSHQNNTGAGVEAASTTTLAHTDAIITLQGAIAGGAFSGKIDADRIIWIGHSRGGEGVVRAYDRIFDGTYQPTNYSLSDIRLVSSIAPTDFLMTNSANPHSVPYFLIYGAADGDVCGCPNNDVADSFLLFERSTGERASMYIHGADHNDFNCCGLNDFTGPAGTQIGNAATQSVAKAWWLAIVKYVIDGQVAGKEYLWRQYEDLRPLGVAGTIIGDLDYKDPSAENLVIDDFQTNSATSLSSSGGAVAATVSNLAEGLMNDGNTSFTWLASDPWNGMTRARATDSTRGLVFDFAAPSEITFSVLPELADFSGHTYLSVRAAQGTRHTQTVALAGNLTFSVTLTDGDGDSSTIEIGVYGGGVQRPYLRTGFGTGAGWQNEFEVIRIRLADFTAGGSAVDLSNIADIRLSFGTGAGSPMGRLGIDDLQLDKD